MTRSALAFTGILIPTGTRLDLGNYGSVRRVTDADLRYAPGELRLRLGGAADERGTTPYITLADDIVLEYRYPYCPWLPGATHDTSSGLSEFLRQLTLIKSSSVFVDGTYVKVNGAWRYV